MPNTPKENDIKKRVLELQLFYKSLMIYLGVVFLAVLVWLVLNKSYFWPLWVILAGAGYLGVKFYRLGLVPKVEDIFPFMRKRWVEEEVNRQMRNQTLSTHKPHMKKKEETVAASQVEAAERTTVRKTSAAQNSTSSKKSTAPARKGAVVKKTPKKSS